MLARSPLVLGCVLASCGACKEARVSSSDAAASSASATPSSSTAAAPIPTREPELPPPPIGDGGTGPCKTVDGPLKLARRGPYATALRMGFVDFYANDSGKPALAGSIGTDPRPGTPTTGGPAVSPADTRGSRPPCAVAGVHAFCMNASGEIRRYRLGAALESDNFIARARPGGPVAATMLSGHTLVVYAREHTTSEGVVSEAYAETDDGTELRLSEDGAGATTFALAPHGTGALAVYVDARRGMSPVHARTVAMTPKLSFGKDAVLFIAGGAEPGTRIEVGASGKTAYALLPIAHDLAFGLATVKIDGDPQTDAPVVWGEYPNGLDPAPVAATRDATSEFVARVRPSAAKFGSPRVLEIGRLDATGAFTSLGLLPTTGTPIDLAIAGDGASGFVLGYTAGGAGWAVRLSCEKTP